MAAGIDDNLLAVKLKARLLDEGPISLHDYMEVCLADPEHGYYRAREPFGLGGDFITAPDICQAFGELIGLWCVHVWAELGQPGEVRLIELGPGRGALMSDALRAASLAPAFLEVAEVHLVETSEALREAQKELIVGQAREHERNLPQLHWHDRLEEVPAGPTLLVANEFLDALPVRQYQFMDGVWRERLVAFDEKAKAFAYVLAETALDDQGALPPAHETASEGDILEVRPGKQDLVSALAARTGNYPLSGLFIDYGYGEPALGDSFQAVREHEYTDPLAAPGLADLTAHVDFSELARLAAGQGLETLGPVTQRDFLLSLGIRERAAQLMQLMENIQAAHRFMSGLQRLIEPEQMGHLFKVMALSGAEQPRAPGFEVLLSEKERQAASGDDKQD